MKSILITTFYCLIFIEVSVCQTANLTFPENFLIGVATSSYQIEGAWNVSDKGENVWDWWTHNYPEYIADGSNGDIACDSYNKYLEDVALIRELGADYYRFSISWSRVMPWGFANGTSAEGIQYYRNLCQALLDNGIEPIVTLYHWDHPEVFEQLGGWTNELMVEWFADYARVIFRELGPLVKTFITINEPSLYCSFGYNNTIFAPGKILENMGHYLCVHNSLKAHATAYHIYDEEFRPTQQGQIGMVTTCNGWIEGTNVTDESMGQYFQFNCGWTVHPIYLGDYPEIMKTRIAMISELEGYPFSRLPAFSDEWIQYIKGTSDFFGLNHYGSIIPVFDPEEQSGVYTIDSGIITPPNENLPTENYPSYFHDARGFRNLLNKISIEYGNPPVSIYENGHYENGDGVNDYDRIRYFHNYVSAVLAAVKEDGCNVTRYTIWSLMDNFEWGSGYTSLYGITNVDFNDPNRTRTPKLSSRWWRESINRRELQPVPTNTNRIELSGYHNNEIPTTL